MILYNETFDENNLNDVHNILLHHKSCVKEDVFKKYFYNLYEELNKIIFPDEFVFAQKLYHFFNNDKELNLGLCKVCKKRTSFISFKQGYRLYCGFSCMGADKDFWDKHEKTSLEKYGTKFPAQAPEIKEKIKETNIERYNSTCTLNSHEIRQKIKENNLKKHGKEFYNNPNKISETYKNKSQEEWKEIIEKREKTYENKTGYKNPFSNPNVIKQIKENNLKTYGCEYVQCTEESRKKLSELKKSYSDEKNKEINDKRAKTCQEVYGVEFVSKLDTIKEKISKTKIQKTIDKYEHVIDVDGYSKFICECTDCTCSKCKEKQFTIYRNIYFQRKNNNEEICIIKNPLKQSSHSKEEKEFGNYISEIYNGIIILNDRNILNGMEIDVYLPELKIGYEFNGVYFHSEYYKSKEYHQEKSLLAKSLGIKLIQIWEDDWYYKTDIIKKMIKYELNLCDKINSNDCNVQLISKLDTNNFFNNNSIKEYISSDINLGLYYNNELLEVLTFNYTNNDEIIISQYCKNYDIKIINGFDKILKEFIKKYKPHNIKFYSSLDISINQLLLNNQFKSIGVTSVNYMWANSSTKNLKLYNYPKHRFNFTQKDMEEMNCFCEEDMYKNGYYKCYDSGFEIYELII